MLDLEIRIGLETRKRPRQGARCFNNVVLLPQSGFLPEEMTTFCGREEQGDHFVQKLSSRDIFLWQIQERLRSHEFADELESLGPVSLRGTWLATRMNTSRNKGGCQVNTGRARKACALEKAF